MIGNSHKILEKYRSYFIGFIIFFILNNLGGIAQINTRAQWDAAFKENYKNQDPILDITDANESGKFSWQAHYWIRAYVSMAKTFNDSSYLNKAVKLIDFMLYSRDDVRYARGELNLKDVPYFSAPLYYLKHRKEAAPGWRVLVFGREWRIQTLDDGQITNAIMRFVDLVLNNDKFSFYCPKAQEYIKRVEETVTTHNSLFVFNRFPNVPGSYFYPRTDGRGLYTGCVPFNHSATMAATLILLNKVKGGHSEYRNKAESILNFFKLHAWKKENNSLVWNYNFLSENPFVEDFNHAHIDIGFLILAYKNSFPITLPYMQQLANTLTRNIYLGNGELSWYIDGSNDTSQISFWPIGFDWIDLAEFDIHVLDIAREVYGKKYKFPTWSRPFLGWAEILRWNQLQENMTPSSKKPDVKK